MDISPNLYGFDVSTQPPYRNQQDVVVSPWISIFELSITYLLSYHVIRWKSSKFTSGKCRKWHRSVQVACSRGSGLYPPTQTFSEKFLGTQETLFLLVVYKRNPYIMVKRCCGKAFPSKDQTIAIIKWKNLINISIVLYTWLIVN